MFHRKIERQRKKNHPRPDVAENFSCPTLFCACIAHTGNKTESGAGKKRWRKWVHITIDKHSIKAHPPSQSEAEKDGLWKNHNLANNQANQIRANNRKKGVRADHNQCGRLSNKLGKKCMWRWGFFLSVSFLFILRYLLTCFAHLSDLRLVYFNSFCACHRRVTYVYHFN